MATCTEATSHTAIKKHSCSWCGEAIEIGEQYKRYRYFSDGDAATVKMHPECYDDLSVCARANGNWIEWMPGDAERPKKQVA